MANVTLNAHYTGSDGSRLRRNITADTRERLLRQATAMVIALNANRKGIKYTLKRMNCRGRLIYEGGWVDSVATEHGL